MIVAQFSLIALLFLCISLASLAVEPPAPLPPISTPQQLKWQDRETTMFVHFTVNAFTDREWGDGTEDPKIFNPTRLDAHQWARAAKAGGIKMMILTAKHHDGFCLWPSAYTDHSVKSSPWKDGKGDVVREFVDACREEGLEIGFYLSPWDRHEKSYGDSPKYNEYYRNQLTELLTNYGPVSEIWFDGANGEGPNGKRQVYDWPKVHALARKLQPGAIMFSDAGPDARWIGNESGIAGDPCWAMVDPVKIQQPGVIGEGGGEMLQHGDIDGLIWRPGESDVSIRPGWFWHKAEDDKVRSPENLVDLYFKSVGRNSLLLLNIPPNDQGLFSDPDVKNLKAFRDRLNEIFKTDVAKGKPSKASGVRGGDSRFGSERALDGKADSYWATDDGVTSGWLEVDFGAPTRFNVACIQEEIALGQRVKAYHLEQWDGVAWKTFDEGTTVGHKKLDRFETITTTKVRLVIDDARASLTISAFGLYDDPHPKAE